MNILIIGGAGGIGSELLKDLSNDDSNSILVGYHNKKPNKKDRTPHPTEKAKKKKDGNLSTKRNKKKIGSPKRKP